MAFCYTRVMVRSPPRMSAAALSAAVDSLKPIGDSPTYRRNQLRRSAQPKRQPLFGREREGGASLREAASLAYPYVRPSLLYCLCEIVEGGFVELGAAEGDSWLNDGDFLHLGQHTLHGPHRRRAPRAVFDQAEGALLIVLDK